MKHSWNAAPKWASWLAMDADGYWHWFEIMPVADDQEWLFEIGSKFEETGRPRFATQLNWINTLEKRP